MKVAATIQTNSAASVASFSLPQQAVSKEEFKINHLKDLIDKPAELMEESARLLYSMESSDRNLGQIGLQRSFQLFLQEGDYAACCKCISHFEQAFTSAMQAHNVSIEESNFICVQFFYKSIGVFNKLVVFVFDTRKCPVFVPDVIWFYRMVAQRADITFKKLGSYPVNWPRGSSLHCF